MGGTLTHKVGWVGKTRHLALIGAAVLIVLYLTLAVSPAHAATLTVTNTSNSGGGSLRQAMLDANNEAVNPGHDTIAFNIPTSDTNCDATTKVCTITPSSALPTITSPLTVDGYTQGDATASTDDDATENTLAQGTNAALKVELDGTTTVGASGLQVNSDGVTVRGLIINDFDVYGIILGDQSCLVDNSTIEGNFIGTNAAGTASGPGNLQGGVSVCGKNNVVGGTTPAARNVISGNSNAGIAVNGNSFESQQHRIEGNLIGTNAAGTSAVPNANGVTIGALAGGNLVGGTTAASRNIISGNSGDGVALFGDTGNFTPGDIIQGNYIGTNVTGDTAVPNVGNGISISNVNKDTTIGGSATGAGNVISGNQGNGIAMDSTGNTVQGNLIGLGADGTGSLGNGNPTSNSGSGVLVNTNNTTSNNTIGGTAPGAGNKIANNVLTGVVITNISSAGNAILQNSVFSNGRLGIDLGEPSLGVTFNDTGDGDNFVANRGQNFPVVTSASISGGNATVSGTLNSNSNATFRLEFFANESCNANVPNFPGEQLFGEGQTFIGTTQVTTDGSGNASFGPVSLGSVPAGQSVITATATNNSTNNTSEFSQCQNATTPPADNTPPTLDTANNVTPRNGQTRVSRTTNIRATFSEPMSLSSLQASGVFTLKNTRNGSMVSPASITLSSDGRTATFDPAPPKLAKKTRYEVRIKGGSGGAADLAGNALAADAVWTFTTKRR
jgi:hypothetical protein